MDDWTDGFDDIYTCPVCGVNNCVPPDNIESPIIIVGEFPGKEELVTGIPLTGRTGTILKQSLAKMGWSLDSFCLCNLWQHKPNKNEKCLEHGKKIVIETAKDKQLVLLVGSDVAKAFLTKNISELNGLDVSEFLKVPAFRCKVMAMVNPAIVFHGVHGEVELSLKKFIKEVEKIDE